MVSLGNLCKLFDYLKDLRRQYDDLKRAGAKAEQTAQIVTQLIALLTQVVQTPLAKDVGAAIYDMVQSTWSQVTRDPYFTTTIAEYLRTRIKVLDDAVTQFADAFSEASYDTSFGQPDPAVLIPTTVLDQVPMLFDILYRTAYECKGFALLIPTSQSVLESMFQFEPGKAGYTTALNMIAAATGTAPAMVAAPFPTAPNLPVPYLLIPIKPPQRLFWTQGAKARYLLAKVRWFTRWLHFALQQRRTTIDQAGILGLYDPVALSHVASMLVMETGKAWNYCDQLSKNAASLLNYP